MTTLYFVRHGESRANVDKVFTGQTDVPLSDRGMRQAEELKERLLSLRPDAFFSSDLLRAVQTVTPAAEALGLAVRPEKGLRVDYQDSDASARDSVADNLRRHPHAARVLFSAEGQGEAGAYNLLLANPPYFGDWRIAEFFIQTAARLLKRGGLIAFVAKREAKPLEFLQANGLNPLGSFPRRGYTVLLAEKQ